MDKIAVLIPCFNECKTIEKVVNDFRTVLPEAIIIFLQGYQWGKEPMVWRYGQDEYRRFGQTALSYAVSYIIGSVQ